jgi:Luciferase-like monooxygenase
VTLSQIDPDDAITEGGVLDLMERAPKLEHPCRRVEVRPIRVRLRENPGALSNVMNRGVINRVDERVRPVAPVDAARSVDGEVDLEALDGLDALKADHGCSHERPREARTTVVRQAGLEGRNGEGVANDDRRSRSGHRCSCGNGEQRRNGEPERDLLHVLSPGSIPACRSECANTEAIIVFPALQGKRRAVDDWAQRTSVPRREAVLAEAVGIDSFNVGEHYRPEFMDSAGHVILAAIAGRTERIRLGTAVTVLSTQDPVRLYTEFASGRGERSELRREAYMARRARRRRRESQLSVPTEGSGCSLLVLRTDNAPQVRDGYIRESACGHTRALATRAEAFAGQTCSQMTARARGYRLRTSMVRRGSTVQVRQRALCFCLLSR